VLNVMDGLVVCRGLPSASRRHRFEANRSIGAPPTRIRSGVVIEAPMAIAPQSRIE
jgi:hypothetical protein